MRLINTRTLGLVEFFGNNIPKYAILSHTWGEDEVTFKDWKRLSAARNKTGFSKIDMACRQALKDGLDYLWVDTNCIDKKSSAELSEAINSMFSWYKNAAICYAYLSDVKPRPPETAISYADWAEIEPGQSRTISKDYWEHFRQSRWFTRGWTLQELLAPGDVVFYARDWSEIAARDRLAHEISGATGIPKSYCGGGWTALSKAPVARRMSWLSRRETTRIEDMAYCMLGIFDINMPLLYGEGSKAFTRLQEEIIRTSTDHTIFCWTWTEMVPEGWSSLLAPCPQVFKNSGGYVRSWQNTSDAYTMTNAGLRINLPVLQTFSYDFGVLNARHISNDRGRSNSLVGVPLQQCMDASSAGSTGARRVMQRGHFPPDPLLVRPRWAASPDPLYIDTYSGSASGVDDYFPQRSPRRSGCSFLLLFDAMQACLDIRGYQRSLPFGHFSTVRMMERFEAGERTETVVAIEVFPDEKFNAAYSLITLADDVTIDGVLIRLGSKDRSSVIFLGAEFNPDNTVLRRFGGVIPHQSKISQYYLGDKLLEVLLNLMGNEEKPSWIRTAGEFGDNTTNDIGFDFGEEVLRYFDGYLFPVFITYEEKILGLIKDPNDEGTEMDNDSCYAGSTAWWEDGSTDMGSDMEDWIKDWSGDLFGFQGSAG